MEPIQPVSYTLKPVPAIKLRMVSGMPVAVITGLKLSYAFLKTSKDFIK
jgi:hypothetical protein